jgi:hypothetical protein
MNGLLCIQIARRDGKPIAVERWKELIDSDPELAPIAFAEGVNPMTGKPMRVPYKGPAAVWLTHPEGYTNAPFVFAYEEGLISALCVDRALVRKGEEIAQELNAAIVVTVD